MSSLPNIEQFKDFKVNLVDSVQGNFVKESSTKDMDLNNYHHSLVVDKEHQQFLAMDKDGIINPTHLLYKNIFTLQLLRSFNYEVSDILNKYIGFSTKYQSLTISVFDKKNSVKSIAIQKATTQDGTQVKWKSYGTKTYITSKLNDDFIFIGVGMKELVLFEMMKVSYIHLQSDSMVRHISQEIIDKCNSKSIIILQENDESFKKVVFKLQELFKNSYILVIDIAKLANKQDIKGYDFVDYCNDIGDIGVVEYQLEQSIIRQIKERK